MFWRQIYNETNIKSRSVTFYCKGFWWVYDGLACEDLIQIIGRHDMVTLFQL